MTDRRANKRKPGSRPSANRNKRLHATGDRYREIKGLGPERVGYYVLNELMCTSLETPKKTTEILKNLSDETFSNKPTSVFAYF